MAQIIDGKAVAKNVKAQVAERAARFLTAHGRKVGLAVIVAGDNAASKVYVRNKIKSCEECGIASFVYSYGADVTQAELINKVNELNNDSRVDGILVQLPLPRGIDSDGVLSAIDPNKDADGFHALNAGRLFLGKSGGSVACTPRGIMELIASTGVTVCGKRAVVVGRSNIVGKPIAQLLLAADATVTVCHSKTENLADITRTADILVVAIGKKNFITANMVKRGAVVIDVGMNRDESGLHGDVDFDGVKDIAGYITPVPGGVGPMTVAMLLKNTVEAAFA